MSKGEDRRHHSLGAQDVVQTSIGTPNLLSVPTRWEDRSQPCHQRCDARDRRSLSNDYDIQHNRQLRHLQPFWLRPGKDNRRPKTDVSNASTQAEGHTPSNYPSVNTKHCSSRTGHPGLTAVQHSASSSPEPPKAGFLSAWLSVLHPKTPSSRALSPTEDIDDFDLGPPPRLQLAACRARESSETTSSTRGMVHPRNQEYRPSSNTRISYDDASRRVTPSQKKDNWFSLKRKSSITPAKTSPSMANSRWSSP